MQEGSVSMRQGASANSVLECASVVGRRLAKHCLVAGDLVMMREPPSTVARQFADNRKL